MFEIALWVAGIVLLLTLMASIPGLKLLLLPLTMALGGAVIFVARTSSDWVVFILKSIASAHANFVKHLIYPAEHFDPSIEIRRKERGEE